MDYELKRYGPRNHYYVFWIEGRRTKRRSSRTGDWEKAKAFRSGLQRELDRPEKAEPAQVYVGTLIDEYWNEKGKKSEAAKSRAFHKNHVQRFHENDTVADLHEDRQDEYEALCVKEGAAPGTINNRRGILRAALRHALRRGRITTIPLIPTLDEPEADSRHFTRDQVARLIKAARAKKDLHHAAIFICLMIATGHRMTAVLQLTWDRVDLEHGTADFRLPNKKHKRKKRTTAALPNKIVRLLKNWKRRTPGPHVVSMTGKFAQHFQRRHWKRVIRGAGLEKEAQRTHTLKHTAATWALRVASPWMVEGQMATSSKTLLRVYGKHLTGDSKTLAEAVAHARPGKRAQPAPNAKSKPAPKRKAHARKKR